MTLIKPHVQNTLRWGTDSDMETLATVVRRNPDTPGIGFARKIAANQEVQLKKDLARDKVVELFCRETWGDKTLRILTLPGTHWRFEKALYRSRREITNNGKQHTFIVSLERESPIFAASLAKIPGSHLGIRHHPEEAIKYATAVLETPHIERYYCASFEAFARYNKSNFDAAWLDFTGPLTTELLVAIPQFWKRVKSTLVVTGLAARWNTVVGRQLSAHGSHHELLSSLCKGSRIADIHDYFDGVPMFQVVLTRYP